MTDYEFKVIVVGDAGVGKTTMISSLLGDTLEETYIPSQGVKVNVFRMKYKNKNIVLKLWDMAGGDDYRTYIAGCFGGAKAAIITYSMTDVESFLHIKNWYETINSVFEIKDPRAFESLQMIVLGLKSDSKMIQVSADQGESAAQAHGCCHFTGNYHDPESYQIIIYKLLDMLLANVKQDEKDVKMQQNRQAANDDPSQPLIKKDDGSQEKSICDCGCEDCTIL